MKAQDILKRAKAEGTPLIDGETVTFVWEGKKAPYLLGDFNFWNMMGSGYIELEKLSDKVWIYAHEMPGDSYLEYAYFTDLDDPDSRVLDPLNSNKISNGMGKYNNYFDMPEAIHTKLTRRRPGIPRGTLAKHTISQDTSPLSLLIGRRRSLWFYQPAVDEEVPLLLVYDGRDYLRRAKITSIVDNLIDQKRIQPIALALIDSAGNNRMAEYHTSEAMLHTVIFDVLPLAREHLKLVSTDDNPGAFGVLGASMGGLMALYTGLRMPNVFGKVISQSGAFAFDYGETGQSLIDLLVKALPRHDLAIWQDVGRMEWLIDKNREMRARLEARGYPVTYREHNSGHNYTAWRDLLPDALETLFGRHHK